MSFGLRRVVGAMLGLVVRGLAAVEAAVETSSTVLPLMPRPRYDVSIRFADGRYCRAEFHGGTRESALAKAQECYPGGRVVSLTRVRRRPLDRGVMWGIE